VIASFAQKLAPVLFQVAKEIAPLELRRRVPLGK